MSDTELRHTITNDGSSTLFSSRFEQHYHSVYGAITESMHVFIEAGFQFVAKHLNEVSIFEMGMGTGLNVLLTYLHSGQKQISYSCVEAHPLGPSEWSKLNYIEQMACPEHAEIYDRIHQIPWDKPADLSPTFTLHKIEGTIQNYESTKLFDLIYFDAFAPNAQPELWTTDIFAKLFHITKTNGALTTYSAKGDVRRALQKVGYEVNKLPGPPGKREMLRAIKTN